MLVSDFFLIAEQFLSLSKKYVSWHKIKELSEEELQIMFATVFAAGFKLSKIVHGNLPIGNRIINSYCNFIIINEKGQEHYFATGWLDCVLRLAVFGPRFYQKITDDQLVFMIASRIKESIPLEPISLNLMGDFLHESPRPINPVGAFHYFYKGLRDSDEIHQILDCIGTHEPCGGLMDIDQISDIYALIRCRECGHEFGIPTGLKTYGDIRKALDQRFLISQI